MRNRVVLIALTVFLVSCGSGEPLDNTTTTTAEEATTSTMENPTTTVAASTTVTTASEPATSTTLPAIDVEFVDGEVVGPGRVQVALGEAVDVWVLSDVDDEMHVHGYDLTFDLEADVPFHLDFTADVPGIFEVEVHTGHSLLFELEVSG